MSSSETTCDHANFNAEVAVNRILDVRAFIAEIIISCADCGLPFEFIGPETGLSSEKPTVDISRRQLVVPIRPHGVDFLANFPGYQIRRLARGAEAPSD